MRPPFFFASILVLLLGAAIPSSSQVAPAATQGAGLPLAVGAGFSDYNIDWGGGRREDGGTISADWTFRHLPAALNGLGLGVEGRDITVNAPPALSFFQYETAGGGVMYHLLRSRNIVPYAKGGAGYGRVKFAPGYPPGYNTDTRTFYYIGGGADFHAWGHLWVRADYEYQIWQHMFGSPNALTPNGFTIGPEFNLARFGWR